MPHLKLYRAEICPFAQRTQLVLMEKGLEFEQVEINLQDKPTGFEQISPYSKVPVLLDGEVRVYESHIINEYLEERFPEPRLMPAAPAERARMRIWVDFDNTKVVPTFYRLLLAQDAEKRRRLADAMAAHLVFMEREALARRPTGSYWLGAEPTLADFSIFTHLDRLCVLTEYRGVALPSECARLEEWLAAMRERPSVRATAHDDDFHVRSFANYADGTASGTTAQDMRA